MLVLLLYPVYLQLYEADVSVLHCELGWFDCNRLLRSTFSLLMGSKGAGNNSEHNEVRFCWANGRRHRNNAAFWSTE